jgi:acyl carrier protein
LSAAPAGQFTIAEIEEFETRRARRLPGDVRDASEPRRETRTLDEGEGMETAQVYDRLTEIFHDVFDDDDLVVTPALTADDVDEWDSLSHIRLVLSVEKAFGMKFSASEVGRLKNVGEFVDLIQSKM